MIHAKQILSVILGVSLTSVKRKLTRLMENELQIRGVFNKRASIR